MAMVLSTLILFIRLKLNNGDARHNKNNLRVIMKNRLITIMVFSALLLGNAILHAGVLMQGGYSHEFNTTPGGVYKKSFTLKNTGNTSQEIKLYLEDYLFNTNKTNFSAIELHKNPRSSSQWIKFSPNRIVLAPGSERKIDYTLTIPSGSYIGTYWSALIVEPVSPTSLESSQNHYDSEKVHMNIRQVSRHAIQIVAQMGDSGKIDLKLSNPAMNKSSGQRIFSLDTHNAGTRWIKPKVWLDVYNESGDVVGKFKGEGSRIYPNTSVTLPIDISTLKKGKYSGLFVVDGGDNSDILATDINLTIK